MAIGLPLLVFYLQTYVLTAGGFGVAVMVALAVFALALGSVLIRQLAQVLVANLEDMPLREIVLYPFGGTSDLHQASVSLETDVKIAVAGPIAGAVLGSLFLLGAGARNGSLHIPVEFGDPDPVTVVLWWTALWNIFLAFLNLVPAPPLDGGKILRALLLHQGISRRLADRRLRTLGVGLGWLFMLSGPALAIGSDVSVQIPVLAGCLWLGYSLKAGAGRCFPENGENPLAEAHVRDFILSDPPNVSQYLTMQQLAHLYIYGTTNRVFVVRRDDILDGVLWIEDVWNVPQAQWERVRVKHIMTPPERLATLQPRDSAHDILDVLSRRDNRPLPVLEKGRFLGVLRRRNVEAWLASEEAARVRNMPGEKARRLLRYLSR